MWLIGDVVADVMIAAIMAFLLLQANDRRVSTQTHRMIIRIIQMTVETNTVSACLAILSLILFSADSSATYFACPSMLLGKTYSNSLLLSFNNRAYLLKDQHQTTVTASSLLFKHTVQPGFGTNNTDSMRTEANII